MQRVVEGLDQVADLGRNKGGGMELLRRLREIDGDRSLAWGVSPRNRTDEYNHEPRSGDRTPVVVLAPEISRPDRVTVLDREVFESPVKTALGDTAAKLHLKKPMY